MAWQILIIAKARFCYLNTTTIHTGGVLKCVINYPQRFTDIRARMSSFALTLALAFFGATFAVSHTVHAEGQLNIYNWGDYINPEVLTRFTKDTGIKVKLDTYGTNEEMLAKIQAGATGYDIVFPSVHMRDIMQKLGLLHDAKVNTLKGFENIDPVNKRSKVDPESSILPALCLGCGRCVPTIKPRPAKSRPGKIFFALPDKGKKITMLDDLRETIGVALIKNGHSVNSTDGDALKQAEAWLLERKDKISRFFL